VGGFGAGTQPTRLELFRDLVDFRSSRSSSVGHHRKGLPMKYLGLAYFTPDRFAAMAPAEVKNLVSQCPPLDEKMRATGKVLVSASLGDLDSWRTLRPRSGRTQVTDGPYTVSKEVVGGLFIIDADSREEALRIAAMHPAATLGEEAGWAVELIPMDFYLAP
jgi:hypothetical protein